jgi:ribonuclease VapC
MFVDSSALVAILTAEPERDSFLSTLQKAETTSTSAIAIYEASHAVARKSGESLQKSSEWVLRLLDELAIDVKPISRADALSAVEVSARYGKGSGHPARLNMGDCFSYAMARRAQVPLLYKGNDFARTDIA